jgi:cation diffusion facilitator CzcD-associated flavoprotein CzcO
VSNDSCPRVAIIGAGLGGIAAAVNLKRRGLERFTVYEKSGGAGGTWWDNDYPGAECDVPSHLYSFSFKLAEWSRTHARQAEIQAYVESVIDTFGIRPHLRLGTGIASATWIEPRQRYELLTEGGERLSADVIISALGMLNVPQYPSWPGMDLFIGPLFHTARWEHEHDLRGKRIAVVGAGSSATQVVPSLAPIAQRLYVFQREAPWVVPKGDRDYSDDELRRFRRPFAKRLERLRVVRALDRGNRAADPDSAQAAAARAVCLDHIEQAFRERPELAPVMTPNYPFRCKRLIVSSSYYPALTRPNVEVVPNGVTAITRTGIVDSLQVERQVDAVVMATGFRPWDFLTTIEVTGRAGRSLHGVWGDEPEAFLGLTVAGFPNFFMLYGPNTNGGCVSFTLERQAEYAARAVARMARLGATELEVGHGLMRAYNRILARRLASMDAWESSCHNYYHGPTGKNVTQWPWNHSTYWAATRVLGPWALRSRRQAASNPEVSSAMAPASRTSADRALPAVR